MSMDLARARTELVVNVPYNEIEWGVLPEPHPVRRLLGRVPLFHEEHARGWTDDDYPDDDRFILVDDIDQADVALSLCTDGQHRPLLDIDGRSGTTEQAILAELDAIWPPYLFVSGGRWVVYGSSTPGNFHAWGSHPVDLKGYQTMLNLAVGRDLCEASWADHTLRRGFGSLRLPHVRKAWVK